MYLKLMSWSVNTVMKCLSNLVQAEKAWALYEEMKTIEGVVPNAQTYNHLISASCKVSSWALTA